MLAHRNRTWITNWTKRYANLIMDTNEVFARNNGAVDGLHLNADGGDVTIQQ